MSTHTTPHGTARHGTARQLYLVLLILLCTLLPALPASAACQRNQALSMLENNAVPIPFGRVNLQDEALQPFASLLASVAVLPAYRNLPPDTPLWSCDAQDIEREDLHFLVATNGNLGDIGGKEGLKNISATWFTEHAHVGLHQRMDEVELTRNWKRVELRAFQRDTVNGSIHIRIRDLPTLSAELYKVSQKPKFQDTKNFCGGLGSVTADVVMRDVLYSCPSPSSYIQFVGPGLQHDHEGADSHQSRKGITANNGFGYRMYNAMTLTKKPSCGVISAPSVIRFQDVSVREMERGTVLTAPLRIVLRCHNNAISDGLKGRTVIALQASPGSFAAARELKLLTQDGGAQFLLSDHYGNPQIASGVGISVVAEGSRRRRYFADPANPGSVLDGTSGWYPFMQDGQKLPNPDKREVILKLEARLQQLPGQPVTAGKLHATARVVIKVP